MDPLAVRRSFALLVVLVVAVRNAAWGQHDWPVVQAPRALAAQLLRDLDHDDELGWGGVDSLAKWITVQRHDFNGDGVREWVVEGTRYCGTNCARWIYRRLPGGRFAQVYGGGGVSVAALPQRSHGWHHVRDYTRMSCCEGYTGIHVFDGQRYRWHETRYIRSPIEGPGEEHTVYRVSITPPDAAGRRRLALEPVGAGGGVWISARHDVCRARACGAPELRVSSAALPTGRACVTLRGRFLVDRLPRPDAGFRLCGPVTRQPVGGRPMRTLLLHPSRAEWGKLWYFNDATIQIAGRNVILPLDASGALSNFTTRLAAYYRLECPQPYECRSRP